MTKGRRGKPLDYRQKEGPPEFRRAPLRQGLPDSYLKSTKALFSVIHTPQAMGRPTASHARIEVALSCHRPIPIEPGATAAACERACRAATSSGFMNQCGAS